MKKINLNKLDGIIWDMDGVLVDVRLSYRNTILKTVEFFCPKLKITMKDVNAIKQVVGLNNDWDASYALILLKTNAITNTAKFVNNLGKYRKKKEYVKVVDVFQSYFLGNQLYKQCYQRDAVIPIKSGLINLESLLIPVKKLKQMKKKYGKMGIATGRPKFEAEYSLNKFKIRNLFDCVVALEDTKKWKPNPAPIIKVMDKLNLNKTIYIGDSPSDVEAARKANIPCIYIGEQNIGDINFPNTYEFMKETII